MIAIPPAPAGAQMPPQQRDAKGLSLCGFCAESIAFLRKIKRLSTRGRKESPRAMAQWRKTKREDETWAVFIEAVNSARQSSRDPDFQMIGEHLLMLLLLELTKKQSGPKSKKLSGTGLLFAKSSRVVGRPLMIPLDEEQRWMNRAMGTKLGLWGNRAGFRRPRTYDDVLASLLKNGGIDELNRAITDREVLEHEAMQKFNPTTKINSLRRRLSSARGSYSFTF